MHVPVDVSIRTAMKVGCRKMGLEHECVYDQACMGEHTGLRHQGSEGVHAALQCCGSAPVLWTSAQRLHAAA